MGAPVCLCAVCVLQRFLHAATALRLHGLAYDTGLSLLCMATAAKFARAQGREVSFDLELN